MEDDILRELAEKKQGMGENNDREQAPKVPASRLVARKSTDPEAKTKPGDVTRNVATKSTGPHARYWPETRLEIPYSFYGIPAEPFDPKLIKTRMAMGKLPCSLLAFLKSS